MNKLVIIAQRVDENDDIVGFFISWIKEFSKHFEKVVVITQKEGTYHLPSNVLVLSMGKEKGYSKVRQLWRMYAFLISELRASRGLFVHMSPIFAVLAWPVTFIYHKRIILWYLHRAVSWKLRLADHLVYRIVTALKESLNIKSKKIIELGHGIDIEKFSYTQRSFGDSAHIVSVGRISPIKNLETLICAVKLLHTRGIPAQASIIGAPVMGNDNEYLLSLKKLSQDLEVDSSVHFVGSVPHAHIKDYFDKADLSVNLAPRGGLDKVVLESMAMGVPSFTSNEAFRESMGENGSYFIFHHADPTDLASHIKLFLSLDSSMRVKISQDISNKVVSRHSLPKLISSVTSLI